MPISIWDKTKLLLLQYSEWRASNVQCSVLLTLLSMLCYMSTCITYVASSFHLRRLTKRAHQYLIYYSAARLDPRSIFIFFFRQTIDYSSCTQQSPSKLSLCLSQLINIITLPLPTPNKLITITIVVQ